jgi:nucleotide-binding universal stress UspA family protein
MISVDLAIVTFLASIIGLTMVLVVATDMEKAGTSSWQWYLFGLAVIAFAGSFVAGVFALLLNVPLIRRTMQERSRLKTLGVTALSKSLWKASRRHRWLSRIRGGLIIFLGVLFTLETARAILARKLEPEDAWLAVFYGIFAIMLFGARHLRNQREQMDLAANAVELKKALQTLRQQVGATGTITVPAELVERAAKIESAHIAMERTTAILQSADSQSGGYAITFEDKAAEQRAALDVTDRLELEDLLAYLSTAGHPPDTQPVPLARGGTGSRVTTENKRVQVEYTIDRESRGIRITAVKHLADEVGHVVAGASGA